MTMKIYRLTSAIVLYFLFCVFSVHPLLSQTSGPNTVFWEISGNGLLKPSYLFGTIHILPKDEFVAYELADQKLTESEQLILEMEIDVPMKTQVEWAKKLMLPEGSSIPDFMETEDFLRLKSYALDSLQVKEFLFNAYLKMKPFAFYSALIPHVIGKKIEGYELHFSKLAKKEQLPVVGLETFDFQLGIFDSIPNETQLKMFFDEDTDLKSELKEMLEMYQDQDIYSMAESLEDASDKYAEMETELLIKRNIDWAEKLPDLMKQKPSFIAVGAGHLAGEHGLIKLLREKGFAVEPIMLSEN